MNNHPNVVTDSTAVPSHWIWVFTLTVASLPVVIGLYQVWMFFDEAFPHFYWSRTLPALAGIALAIAGIAAPLSVLIKRKSFIRRSRVRQWQTFGAVLVLMCLAYFVPFVLLAEAARKARAILPYTPSVILLHSKDDEELFKFGVLGGPPGTGSGDGHRSGSGHRGRDDVTVTWNEWLEPSELSRRPGPDPVVHLRCEASPNRDPMLIKVEVQTGRRVRFDTRGFVNPVVEQNGKPVALPMELDVGTHQFTIRAKP